LEALIYKQSFVESSIQEILLDGENYVSKTTENKYQKIKKALENYDDFLVWIV
jgi:hypothetical protein